MLISYLVIFCLLIYLVIFSSFIIKQSIIKDVITKKIKFNFKSIGKSYVISSIIWSLIGTIAIVYICSLLFIVCWSFISSFRDEISFSLNPLAFPNDWKWENYEVMFSKLEIKNDNGVTYFLSDMLLNSVVYATVPSFVSVFWLTLVAYAIARTDFFWNKILYNLGLLVMMIPIVGNLAASMEIQNRWGLYDNMYLKILIPPSTAFSGLHFMILHGALKAIPKAFSEAAYIDGANQYNVMFNIIIPMVLPTCATIFILDFIANWNAYETILIWFPSTPNLAYGMYKFQIDASKGASALTEPQILSGFIFAMIPSVVLYISSQKLITSKFTVGGLKG